MTNEPEVDTTRALQDEITSPPVTIVVPVYNLASFLTETIDSVKRQSYSGPVFIIILDDGSADSSYQKALELTAGLPNVQVHTQANQGRVGARNRLVELAETELIAWLDGDDMASPRWVEEQVAYLQQRPECVAVSGQGYSMTAHCQALGPMRHPLESEQIDRRHLSGEANAFFQSCVVTRKSAVLKAGGYRPQYPAAEDYDLWLRLSEVGRLANCDKYHLYYRVHGTSANATLNVDQRMQGRLIVNEARERRGLAPLAADQIDAIPLAKKDDWNRRVYWINIALQAGNPLSALKLLGPAIRRHPCSLLIWIFAIVAAVDCLLFCGNRTKKFRPGVEATIRTLPQVSLYRLGRSLFRCYQSMKSKNPNSESENSTAT